MYKNASHGGQCATLNLCNDIETNPGSPIHSIDPTQAIKAPYGQGDIMYFGENAGKQCVAMSLSALIYNKIKGIHSCNDLYKLWRWVINCIQHCHNVQGRCNTI